MDVRMNGAMHDMAEAYGALKEEEREARACSLGKGAAPCLVCGVSACPTKGKYIMAERRFLRKAAKLAELYTENGWE